MKRKFSDLLLVLTASVLLVSLGAGVVFLPKSEISEEENRVLATLSPPTLGDLLDGSFFSDVGKFYRDRIPFRTSFVSARTISELALLKGEAGGVILCRDGYLLARGEYETFDIAKKNLAYLSELSALCDTLGVPVVSAIAPRGVDVLRSKLPLGFRGGEGEIWRLCADRSYEYVDLIAPLSAAAEDGGYVWFMTDHHWTSRGAYLVYRELSSSLGYSPYGEDFFTVSAVSRDFLGSNYSRFGCIAPRPDALELYRYEGDGGYRLSADGWERDGLYFFERLSEKDKYAVFLGGNYSRLTIEKPDGEPRPRLVIIKDSYANSLCPFLALHFDLELIDLRYFEGGMSALSDILSGADGVLVLCGVDTIATTRLW